MTIKLEVPPLPEGTHENVIVYRAYGRVGRLITFVKIAGVVYADRHYGLNLVSSNNVNDDVRRAYCRLAGIKFKDMQAAVRAERIRLREVVLSDAFHDVERSAGRLGYRLVRVES